MFLLSRVDFFIYNSGFALFYQHVRHFHSTLAPFHIVCVCIQLVAENIFTFLIRLDVIGIGIMEVVELAKIVSYSE